MSLADELVRCRPFLEPALAYNGGTHAWDDVAAAVEAGRMQFWPAPDGALVTEVVTTPRQRLCNVFLGGGELGQLLDMVTSVEAWARAAGCDAITVHGRKGWARALAGTGANPLHVALRKEL